VTDEAVTRPTPRRIPVRGVVAAAIAVIVVGAIAFSVGRISGITEPTPTSTSAAAGFARDMQVHHDQGVELALLVRDRSEDADIRSLAYDIATAQSNQSGQMYGWLVVWGLPQASPEPSMTWMTRPSLDGQAAHGHDEEDGAHEPGAPMPGLATLEQVQSLQDATGVEAEVIFLELMIAHHQGAIDMSEAVLERTDSTLVKTFATGVIAAQEKEIVYMETLLAART